MKAEGGPLPGRAGPEHPVKLQPGPGSALKIRGCGPPALSQGQAIWLSGLL